VCFGGTGAAEQHSVQPVCDPHAAHQHLPVDPGVCRPHLNHPGTEGEHQRGGRVIDALSILYLHCMCRINTYFNLLRHFLKTKL